MTMITISLRPDEAERLQDRASTGGYADLSDYVAALVRSDLDAERRLDTLREDLRVAREGAVSERSVMDVFADATKRFAVRP